MNNNSDIQAILVNIKTEFDSIKKVYQQSLEAQEIPDSLRLKVKHFLEDCRSALDYCAHDIANTVLTKPATKIYFPIIHPDNGIKAFDSQIGQSLPGLRNDSPKLYNKLESIQPYHSENLWLAELATTANDNKHTRLTPQKRVESHRVVTSTSQGSSVSWDPSSVRFGSGVYINGAPINPDTQMPIPTPGVEVQREVWVDFQFENGTSVLQLLGIINRELPKLINDIYSLDE